MNIAFDPLPRFFSIGIPALKRRNSRIYTSGDFIFQQKKKINTNAIPSVYREWWRQKVPKIFSPVPSMNYQKPTEHIEEEDVKRLDFVTIQMHCSGDLQFGHVVVTFGKCQN